MKVVGKHDRQTADKLTLSHLKTMFSGKSSGIMESEFHMQVSDTKNKKKAHKYAFSLKPEVAAEAIDDTPAPVDGDLEDIFADDLVASD